MDRVYSDRAYNRVLQSLYNTSEYSEVVCLLDAPDEMVSIKRELSGDRSIMDWLSLEKAQWRFERPPIELYAKYLVIAEAVSELPKAVILDILKAFIYYGNYEKVIDIANSNWTEPPLDYSIAKQLAKAYKCLGKYEKTLDIYRKAIQRADKEGNIDKVSLFILLIGKLYDDYHQKKGMRLLYHKVAFTRAKQIAQGVDGRTYDICAECYAKLLYRDEPQVAEEIYTEICDKIDSNNELFIRYKLNWLVVTVRSSMNTDSAIKEKELVRAFKEMETYTIKLRDDYKNERVVAIRNTQRFSLYRELLHVVKKDGKFHKFKVLYSCEYVLDMLRDSIRICRKYNERKYLAYSLYEHVKWSIIKWIAEYGVSSDFSIPQNAYIQLAQKLNEAIDILSIDKDNGKYLVSDVYIDVLQELESIYAKMNRVSEALSASNEIYRYFQALLLDVRHEANELRNAVNNVCINISSSEYLIFTKDERVELFSSLHSDYDALTEKLLDVGREIHPLLFRDAMESINNSITSSNNFIYHSLLKTINNAKNLLSDGRVNIGSDIFIEYLQQLENNISSFRKDNISLVKYEKFDIIAETKKFINNSEFVLLENSKKIDFSIDKRKVLMVMYNKYFYYHILHNLLHNVVELAEIKNINVCKVKIFFDLESVEADIDVYLNVYDNVGGYSEFDKIIQCINSGKSYSSTFDGERGTGLSQIKKITLPNIHWQLTENGDAKCLSIPLCHMNQ